MAFDRTRPPGEAVLAQTPQASFSHELGRTYVAPEEVREFLLLSEREQELLAAWAQRLIGADEHWPSAAEVGAPMYADNCASRSPLLRCLLPRALAALDRQALELVGVAFLDCEERQRDAALAELERGPHAALFELVLELVFEGYYRAEPVLEAIERRTGFQVDAPLRGVALEPFDEALLGRVRGLPPLLRQVVS
ncbi:MAG: gluconate 2-dehydrogenase subunit 3 family protein [Solirubrobacteraceae bacterium]